MSVYCYRCGQRLAGGARHCPSCGAAIFYDENGLRSDTAQGAEEIKEETGYWPPEENAWEKAGQTGQNGAGQQENAEGAWQQTASGTGWQQNNWQQNNWQQNPWQAQNPRQPYGTAGHEKAEGYARTAMIFGIASAILCFFMPFIGLPASIAALVLGILGRKAVVNKGKAITGLVLGIIFLILNGLVVGLTVYYIAHPELLENLLKQWGGYIR